MATNGAIGRASSVASSSGASFVDASGYKFSDKDNRPGKLKVSKKTAAKIAKAGKKGSEQVESKEGDPESRASSSPILPEMDEKIMATFPNGKLREAQLETVICKHCKRPVLKQTSAEHIRGCLKAKQEKARKKKEARDAANRAKEKALGKDKGKDGDDKGDDGTGLGGDDGGAMKGQKSAKKSAAGEDGPKKGKKRKADGDDDKDKEPKKKKKKDEPKPKVPKPKGPVDVEKQCGVPLPNGGQCARSLTCKSHSMGSKRAVPGRSLPYDMLLQAYQKKNQARQQKAAIDANAPIHDDIDGNGAIDSDEEKDTVMAGLARSNPQPLITHPLIPTRRKYHLVRMKEMLSQVLGGTRGGIFSQPRDTSSQSQGQGGGGRTMFPSDSTNFSSSPTSAVDSAAQSAESSRKPSISQQAAQNRASQAAAAAAAAKKPTATASAATSATAAAATTSTAATAA
ncbi:SAGA-associated factor 73 [Blastomyces dermatitidis ER-3]|uniref:SAGA-associated factor 73 n=3 Tax=Blastomyces TaxID=229219 RepID=A0A179V016_BLAGS|nr:SAGA-associated factor 73 [Blastomyces gilchristii SLH14081]XP_045271521.1 SAGA-associated factor 73 [Blastomyces dermatitidis ER-3]EGE81977.2 SAGA-associated factor 73 [Blastomyces dermatitidis ATCC 18188]EQL35807.1 SAGA-associated factor 73 [Blastomyces dermatitidis ATCC 26199]EEQ83295.2 SAGA-associated factor 73 [Blastomyces dermatitidis ER-3]OAT12727.1 SAGA-associated factor 73 [Blastomyces gilchristii SLH14081]